MVSMRATWGPGLVGPLSAWYLRLLSEAGFLLTYLRTYLLTHLLTYLAWYLRLLSEAGFDRITSGEYAAGGLKRGVGDETGAHLVELVEHR